MALRLLLWPNVLNVASQRMSNNTRPRGMFKCSVSTNSETARRGSANYQPTLWTYDYLQSLAPRDDHRCADEQQKRRAQILMERVRNAINDEDAETLTTLALVDDVQHMGLGYLFEEDIMKALRRFLSMDVCNASSNKTLHDTAFSFRVLRQNGFAVSQDVFKTFMDENGKFKTTLLSDIRGMLSLHEATSLAFEEDDILQEARAFTINGLKNVNKTVSRNFADQVNLGLKSSVHHRMPLLEAQSFIEASSASDMNCPLVELAVVHFEMVQSTLQRDLLEMSRWWNGVNLAKKLNFARDRIVECFFWAIGMVYEPHLSNSRKGLTKVAALITTIDDVYDVYGRMDELELFTDAVQRWDINVMETLPGYMKPCFLALFNTVHEIAYDILNEKGVNAIPYLTKAWGDMCKAMLQEAKWGRNQITPTFDDYLNNGFISSSGPLQLTHLYCSTTLSSLNREEFASIDNYHDLFRLPSMIFRLYNDLATSSAELKKGETTNSIKCYMQETGASEEMARDHVKELIDTSWKKMNEYQANGSMFKKSFVRIAFNLARIVHCTYQDGDAHGAPDEESKNRVRSLLIEPIKGNNRKN